jgi:hypothetical protein
VSFLQLKGDVLDEKLIAGNSNAVRGIEVREVRKLARELVA